LTHQLQHGLDVKKKLTRAKKLKLLPAPYVSSVQSFFKIATSLGTCLTLLDKSLNDADNTLTERTTVESNLTDVLSRRKVQETSIEQGLCPLCLNPFELGHTHTAPTKKPRKGKDAAHPTLT
jgi:hypothetical protein